MESEGGQGELILILEKEKEKGGKAPTPGTTQVPESTVASCRNFYASVFHGLL